MFENKWEGIFIGFITIIMSLLIGLLPLLNEISKSPGLRGENGEPISFLKFILINPDLLLFVFLGIVFFIAGVIFLTSTFRRIRINKYGIDCYGIVKKSLSNNYSIAIINPDTMLLEEFNNILFTKVIYDEEGKKMIFLDANTFILCKYYKGKVIIIDEVEPNVLNDKDKELLGNCVEKKDLPDW